jgi:hypothetical protein
MNEIKANGDIRDVLKEEAVTEVIVRLHALWRRINGDLRIEDFSNHQVCSQVQGEP